jgi:hypothetical protein
MKKMTTAIAFVLTGMSGAALAVDGNVRIGAGVGELADGGASIHSTHLTARGTATWESGFTAGLRYVADDYDGGLELSYITAMAGWALLQESAYDVTAGLLLERLRFEDGGASVTDDAIGAQIGAVYRPANGVELGLELGYLQTNDDNEDVFETVITAEIDIATDIALGLEYWTRTIEASDSSDTDQDAITVTLGFDF